MQNIKIINEKICRKCGKKYNHNIDAIHGFCSFRCKRKWEINYDFYMLNGGSNICYQLGIAGKCPQDYNKCPYETEECEILDCMEK